MSARRVQLIRAGYRDSVRLMQISAALRTAPGVAAALVAMATDVNLELATRMGFAPPPDAGPNDLLAAVAADDEQALAGALNRLDAELNRAPDPGGGTGEHVPPRTVGSAVRRSDANVVLVSTPGRYAFLDAMDALDAGASVMLFSDNVPVEQEVLLKEVATARGLLVMGPDCGTAVIAGVGLGFANVVRPGPVGIVAASGTGAQQVLSLLSAAGVGISHCLGVGGRDLWAPVGGRSTLAALDALDRDEATELILVVSKPPAGEVATRVRGHAAGLATPVVFALLGPDQPDLTAAVTELLHRLGRPVPQPWPRWSPSGAGEPPAAGRPRAGAGSSGAGSGGSGTGGEPGGSTAGSGGLRGLFCGGTLRDEAQLIVDATIGPGATMVDFGADELTRGRPHPMIDGTLRLERLAVEAADPSCRVLLLDVVLGHAADPDPAATLAPAVAAAHARGPAVVVSLTGTADDPQGLLRQAAALCEAGATVFLSNAEAARYAASLASGGGR